MTDVHVSLELAVATFEKIMEEKGADTMVSTCQIYTTDTGAPLPKNPKNVGRKVASCAVGQIYAALVPDWVFQANTDQIFPELGWDVNAYSRGPVVDYLKNLQIVQDTPVFWNDGRSFTWGEAHKIALDNRLFSLYEDGTLLEKDLA